MTQEHRIMQRHFERMWPERHKPLVRSSIRDNIRGQRKAKEAYAKALH